MSLRAFAAAALLATGTPALAQDAAPTPAEPVKEKKICRTSTATGSIVPKRKCMTKAEWVRFDADNAQNAEKFRDRMNSGSRMGPGN